MKKRIVYIVGDLSYPNGMSQVLSQKVNYLAEFSSYEVYVVLTEKACKPHYYTLSSKVKYVNFDINFEDIHTMSIIRKLFFYYVKMYKYRHYLEAYLMTIHPNITVSVLRREINFINKISDGSKKVGEIHFNQLSYRVFDKSYLPVFINKKVTKYWKAGLMKEVGKLDHFVVLTKQDYLNWNGITNISIIPNPIAKYPEVKSECNRNHVIAVGRYTWQKGFDMLISAWKNVHIKHPNWILDIYGAGNPESYRQIADKNGISSVVLCHEATSDIYKKYAESSIFVLSSRFEGFGLVLAEAMATGLPVISFRCPCGPEDIITNGKDGILVENGNILALSDAICYLIENEDVRKDMGREGMKSAERYREEHIMQQWIQLFNSIA